MSTGRIVHILVFVLAGVVFYVGLVVGLQYSSTAGTLLWLASGLIAVGNVLWWWMRRRGRH